MASIPYPLIGGARQSFVSTEITFQNPNIGGDGASALNLALRGYKDVKYSRKRERSQGYGNHPDPLFKTRGVNKYEGGFTFYLEEVRAIFAALSALAPNGGYGDVFFNVVITHTEEGQFTTHVVELIGCTFDTDDVSLAQGTEATAVQFDLTPMKIIKDGQDDCDDPLQPAGGN